MPAIRSWETFAVAYPVRGRFKFFPDSGKLPPGRRTVVVCLTDDAGRRGWGQAVPSPRWSYETPESVRTTIDLYLAPELLGVEIEDVATIERRLNAAIAPSFSTGMPIAKAALDLALWDLRGRIAGKSVGERIAAQFPDLSARNTPVTLSWTINVATIPELEASVEEARRRGYRHFNVKVAPDASLDVELCRRLRNIAPDALIWADANGGYDLATALAVAPRLADCGVQALEQPLPANRLDGFRRIRAQGALPILMDEGIVSVADFDEFHRLGLLDGVAVKASRMGGLTESLRLVRRLHDAGSLFYASGLTDPDLSLAASLHLFAHGGLTLPAALNGPQFLAGSILGRPLLPTGDQLAAPSGPGLGVDVNESAMQTMLESVTNT